MWISTLLLVVFLGWWISAMRPHASVAVDKSGRNLKVVAALADISDWSPAPGVSVVRPAGMPAKGALYLAFPDGFWLQGGADTAMVGLHADSTEFSAAWGSPKTLDAYWATLVKAAK